MSGKQASKLASELANKLAMPAIPAMLAPTALLVILLTFSFTACSQAAPPRAEVKQMTPEQRSDLTGEAKEPPAPPLNAAIDKDAPEPLHVSGERALQYTKQLVALGPRWNGGPGHKKAEEYLRQRLQVIVADAKVEEDGFTAQTPVGPLPMRNFIAKFPGQRDGIIVIASHYDTNYPLRNTNYVGANDGASSSALLLELAQQFQAELDAYARQLDFAGRVKHLNPNIKRPGYTVWLVWDDGEEAISPDKIAWTDDNSLYGVRRLAEAWAKDGTSKKIKAFLLLDMIGDADLSVMREANSTPWLEDLVEHAADRLTYKAYFFQRQIAVEDDHIPFLKLGVPVADLIDFDYGYNNVYWHTPQDTVDKLSAKSLEIVGSTTLETVKMLDRK